MLATAPGLRFRQEYFGSLAWRINPRRLFRLDEVATTIALLYRLPRQSEVPVDATVALQISRTELRQTMMSLVEAGVLIEAPEPAETLTPEDVIRAAMVLDASKPKVPVLKPLWAHLQPFTLCNQHCIHCYCSGGPKADPFLIDVDTWREIVAKLDDYGVLDVYVTGGESLLLDGFFEIADEILARGLGFGVSTNATVLSDRVLDRLRQLRIGAVQVSLDGATAATHELIRGAPGSFTRTLVGISRISQFADPVINTVVNSINLDDLEEIVRIGIEHGCRRFKFFPEKPVGRSTVHLTLDDEELMTKLVPECARLAEVHHVEIETVDPRQPCGSGSVGFAVDQRADIYPCIFGVRKPTLRCGNLLADDLDTVWFDSPVLARFRKEVETPCRRCEA